MLDELKSINSTKKAMREFGLTIGIILVILGVVSAWRGRITGPYLIAAGALFIALGFILPVSLKWPQKIWMGFAVIAGFFVSRLVLIALFYIIMTPVSFIVKISGKDILDERIERSAKSYWKERAVTARPREDYGKQY